MNKKSTEDRFKGFTREKLIALDMAIGFAGCNPVIERSDWRKIKKAWEDLTEGLDVYEQD